MVYHFNLDIARVLQPCAVELRIPMIYWRGGAGMITSGRVIFTNKANCLLVH